MRVLLLAAEFAPLAKIGGLGDVVGELPLALKSLGVDIRVYIPFHQTINRAIMEYEQMGEVLVSHQTGSQVAKIYRSRVDGLDLYLVDGDPISKVDGIYSDPASDGEKFTFFSLAALKASESAGWKADILHAHDWHTSPAIAWVNKIREIRDFWKDTATLLTVHNLPYMGAGAESALSEYGLEALKDPRLPDWTLGLPLAMGLVTADWVNTVSPTYAQEIQTPAFGHGLEDLIVDRKDHVVGILNGIDLSRWDPQTDKALEHNYDREKLKPRANVRASLLDTLGLSTDSEIPLLAMVTRLDHQKGVDLAIDALSKLLDESWQFVLLGTGDPSLEEMAKEFEVAKPDRVRSVIRFDAQFARNIYAGADMILIPSRYEPCGLTQMIAMRYGCVPIVAATGGLKDTVVDYDENPKGTGFVYAPNTAEELEKSVRRAISAYHDMRRWRGLQRRGMRKDFSWLGSAHKYLALYKIASEERRNEISRNERFS